MPEPTDPWLSLAIGALGGVAVKLVDGLFSLLKWAFARSDSLHDIPAQTIAVVPHEEAIPFWEPRTIDFKPAMFVSCRLYLTNLSKLAVNILYAKLRYKEQTGRVELISMEGFREETKSGPTVSSGEVSSRPRGQKPEDMWGRHSIPPAGSEASSMVAKLEFFFEPPARRKGQDFQTDLAIVDSFGNQHWLCNVSFRSM